MKTVLFQVSTTLWALVVVCAIEFNSIDPHCRQLAYEILMDATF